MDRHFDIKDLLIFVAPSIATLIFTSIYDIVDGFFVSNFVGSTAFASVNFIMPFIMILGSVGFMVGTGGSALVSKARGEGDDDRANRYFSLMIVFLAIAGIVLAIIGFFLMEPIAQALGASESMLPICVLYGRISMLSLPAFMLQCAFQAFFPAADKPRLGFRFTLVAGCTNIVLDALFVGILGWGVVGAASATVITEFIGGIGPIVYFARNNSSCLKLCRPGGGARVIGKTCVNGSSEMMTNIALSLVAMLYNWQLMRYLGEDGVAAYGVISYVFLIFGAVLIGFSMGSAPLMSYQYGAKNTVEMRSLFKNSLKIMGVANVAMFIAAELLAPVIAGIFVSYDELLVELTTHAFRLFACAYLVMGYSIYGSALFTSLGNGLVSAVISFLRTLVFECASVIFLPLLLGVDGIWLSGVVAEVISVALTFLCIRHFAPRYGLASGNNVSD
ncbi:MAG: MATE family efflux transporter [Eggerthellaceae bacterium]|nr:MATE family efflux transporter [Eggerthellaceae bacterium]